MGKLKRSHTLSIISLCLSIFVIVGCSKTHEEEWTTQTKEVERLIKKGELEQALFVAEKTLKIAKQHNQLNGRELSKSYMQVGEIYRIRGQYESAVSSFIRAVEIEEQLSDPTHSTLEHYLSTLAGTYLSAQFYDQALATYQRRLKVNLKAQPMNEVLVATSRHDIARAFMEKGEYEVAETEMVKSLKLLDTHMELNNIHLSLAHRTLGQIYAAQKRYGEAEAEFETAIGIAMTNKHNPHIPPMFLEDLALMYEEANRPNDAKSVQQRIIDYQKTQQ